MNWPEVVALAFTAFYSLNSDILLIEKGMERAITLTLIALQGIKRPFSH